MSLNSLQASLFQNLSAIHSGEFIGTWVERFDSPVEGESFEFSGEIRGKFDDALSCYALQRPVWARNPRTSQAEALSYGIIKRPEDISRYGEGSRIVTIHSLDERSGRSPEPTGDYFDPRAVGVLWWGEIFRGEVMNLPHMQKVFRGDPTNIVNLADGRKRYEWESAHVFKSLLVEDAAVSGGARQVSLSRLERYPDVDNNIWSPPLETQHVSWLRAGEKTLPDELRLESVKEVVGNVLPKSREERRFSTRSVEIRLEWSRVNDLFDREEFAPRWFQVKEGTVMPSQPRPDIPLR